MKINDHIKVAVKLEKDADGYPPVDWEDLWAVNLGNGTYRIDNVPFYAPRLSSGDVVSAIRRGDRLIVENVLEPSGHSTLRVVVYDEGLTEYVRARLSSIGCSTELSNLPTFFSVDVPPNADYSAAVGVLETYAEDGRLDYEESAVRH